MLTSFRVKIGNYFLKRDSLAVRRDPRMVNMKGAKTIGIIYWLHDVPDYQQVSEFVSALQQEHKEVKALGYVEHRNLISRFLPKLSYDFFSERNVNWFYKPVNEKVLYFMERPFDLLIDLTLKDHLPLKFVAGLSRARCKVGRFSNEDTRYYDLMIKAPPMISLREFISQVRHYLTIINKDG